MGRRSTLALGPVLLGACISEPDTQIPADSIVFGALLPFTGERAALGANVENALLMAVDDINDAGGIAGRPIALVVRDTHSEVRRGLDAAEELLAADVVALLGPEEVDLQVEILPRLAAAGVTNIVPGVTAPGPRDVDGPLVSYRISAPAPLMARAFSDRIVEEAAQRADVSTPQKVALVHVDDPYFASLTALLHCELQSDPAVESRIFQVSEGRSTHQDLLDVAAFSPDMIMLMAYPLGGAAIVQEWGIIGEDVQWFLSPTLDTDALLQNVSPGALQGAIGISPAVREFPAARFLSRFEQQWGDFPLTAAYYYYDAMAIAALASASALASDEPALAADVLEGHLLAVTTDETTEPVEWDAVGSALGRIEQGEAVNYEGVSGDTDLTSARQMTRNLLRSWRVLDDRIEFSSVRFDVVWDPTSQCLVDYWF